MKTKKPIVPTKKPQSHIVGQYMSRIVGCSVCCRLVMIITKRSSHMPMLTSRQTSISTSSLRRHFDTHIVCGIIPLHVMSSQ